MDPSVIVQIDACSLASLCGIANFGTGVASNIEISGFDYALVGERGLLGRPKHRAGHKPQARMVARRVRPRLPDGRPRQGEGQAGLLPVLFGGKRPERPIRFDWSSALRWGRSGQTPAPPAYRRDFVTNGLVSLLEELTYVQYNISAHTPIGVSCLALL